MMIMPCLSPCRKEVHTRVLQLFRNGAKCKDLTMKNGTTVMVINNVVLFQTMLGQNIYAK